jgi:hypothetical protein
MTWLVFGSGGFETAGSGRGATRGSTRRITGLTCRASSGARRERSRRNELSTRGVRGLARKVSRLFRERWRPSAGSWSPRSGAVGSRFRAAALALCGASVSVSFGASGRGSVEPRSATRSLEFEYAEALRAGGAEDRGSSRTRGVGAERSRSSSGRLIRAASRSMERVGAEV